MIASSRLSLSGKDSLPDNQWHQVLEFLILCKFQCQGIGYSNSNEIVTKSRQKIKQQGKLREHNGFTYHPTRHFTPQVGYMVARPKSGIIFCPGGRPTESLRLQTYLLKNLPSFQREPDLYLGGWHDPEHGEYHIELTDHLHHREEAVALANLRNQKAIWDISNNREIWIHSRKASGCC